VKRRSVETRVDGRIIALALLSCIACDSDGSNKGETANIGFQEFRIVSGFDVSIVKVGTGTVRISWVSQGVSQYEVWASSDPYFTPGDPHSVLVASGPSLQYSTGTGAERYYRVRAPGAVLELSTVVGQLPIPLYAGYTKLGWCLVSPVDTWLELKADIKSKPSYGAMWDAAAQDWESDPCLTFEVGEVLSVLHYKTPTPSTYTMVGYVPTESDVDIELLPGDNLVTSLPLRTGTMMASEMLEIVPAALRVGGWNPLTQTTHWYPDNGDFVLPRCSPIHVEVYAPSTWPPPAICGDGFTSPSEECDDEGESEDCDSDCTFAICGDGIVNEPAGEQCDDAGAGTGTCAANCTFATCGDGIVNAGEECDGGGESATCNTNCTLAACGDSILNTSAGEACDDGGESENCNADCTLAVCGDSIVNTFAGEQCDDGSESETCNADCTLAVCGDSILNTSSGEVCDDGGESATCNTDCSFATCGDSILNTSSGEACDDGGESATCNTDCSLATCGDSILNTSSGEVCDDGGESETCNADCTFATCGDSIVNTSVGEECDEGAIDTMTCNYNCTAVECGDGYINSPAGEQCDDGNTIDFDGCSSTCIIDFEESCSALHMAGPGLPSGNYLLDPDGSGAEPPVAAYCDMTHNGGGWTNLDFTNNRVLLENGHIVYCHGGLTSTATAITCDNPFFTVNNSMPLFHFACAGTDDSADYILDHMAPLLGHRSSTPLGFATLNQANIPGEGFSVANLEYCYVDGQVVLWSDPICDEYNRPTNANCIPSFFTLTI